jgi:hypothetical protein
MRTRPGPSIVDSPASASFADNEPGVPSSTSDAEARTCDNATDTPGGMESSVDPQLDFLASDLEPDSPHASNCAGADVAEQQLELRETIRRYQRQLRQLQREHPPVEQHTQPPAINDEGDGWAELSEDDDEDDDDTEGCSQMHYHIAHTKMMEDAMAGNVEELKMGCLKCAQRFTVSSSPNGFASTFTLKCPCRPKRGFQLSTSPVFIPPGGTNNVPVINRQLPFAAYVSGVDETRLVKALKTAGVNSMGMSQTYAAIKHLKKPMEEIYMDALREDLGNLYKKVRAAVDKDPEATRNKLWVESPVDMPDPLNKGETTRVLVKIVVRTDGHGMKRSYTRGSNSTEYVTASMGSQPAVNGCEDIIVLDLQYSSCYCRTCVNHFRETPDEPVPEHACAATSDNMAAQAEYHCLLRFARNMVAGHAVVGHFFIEGLVSDGDTSSLRAIKEGMVLGLCELGMNKAAAELLVKVGKVARFGDSSHVSKNATGKVLDTCTKTKVRPYYAHQFRGAVSSKVKAMAAAVDAVRESLAIGDTVSLMENQHLWEEQAKHIASLYRLVDHMNGDHERCDEEECEITRKINALGREPTLAELEEFSAAYHRRRSNESMRDVRVFARADGDEIIDREVGSQPMRLPPGHAVLRELKAQVRKLERTNAILKGSLFKNGTSMVECFWSTLVVHNGGKSKFFGQSKKTELILHIAALRWRFGACWVTQFLYKKMGLPDPARGTSRFLEALDRRREKQRKKKATPEYLAIKQASASARRATATCRRINNPEQTYQGNGQFERGRDEGAKRKRAHGAIVKGTSRKCWRCNGRHGGASPFCYLSPAARTIADPTNSVGENRTHSFAETISQMEQQRRKKARKSAEARNKRKRQPRT